MPKNTLKSCISLVHATNPADSAWVMANAGAGKTQLLVDRVLRLLLSGVHPSAILCITYTNAAAAEMERRVLDQLTAWVAKPEGDIIKDLSRLEAKPPAVATIERARTLFAEVLEAPEGLRIQTIHSFCQTILQRFPLEAGVMPQGGVMDERTAQELLQEAGTRLMLQPRGIHQQLDEALGWIAENLGEYTFREWLDAMQQTQRYWQPLYAGSFNSEVRLRALRTMLGLPQSELPDWLSELKISLPRLREAAERLTQAGGKNGPSYGYALLSWLVSSKTIADYEAYSRAVFTSEGTINKKLYSTKTDPADIALFIQENTRLERAEEQRRAIHIYRTSEALLHAGEALHALYQTLKHERALFDFDDLIVHTHALLTTQGQAGWVLYKLDGGIDHLLIDEAQDTSCEQWALIEALTSEFFAGEGGKQALRSLFVVGDEKQSIFSFQGAAPEAFLAEEEKYAQRIPAGQRLFHRLVLTRSFRSASAVLAAVDKVSAATLNRPDLRHEVIRDAIGHVELWPLVSVEEAEERQPWELPTAIKPAHSPEAILAEQIATTIGHWLQSKRLIRGRLIRPSDIMILVRRRKKLANALLRALKRAGVPVAGMDRMRLTEQLAVRDLMHLAEFMLLPEDDFALACVLKSPVGNLSEEQLFDLAHGRSEKVSLWQRLQESAPHQALVTRLNTFRARAQTLPPHGFYLWLLEVQGMRAQMIARMGTEIEEALDEFLRQAAQFERAHVPTLHGLLHWLCASDEEVKRSAQRQGDEVSIMTVHGAKGLEAPIVILPETTQSPKPQGQLIWHEGLPLWLPAKESDVPLTRALKEARKEKEEAESRRLLYVAMTRAQDELYIGGAQGKKTLSNNCWYRLVEEGLSTSHLDAKRAKA